MRALRLFSLVSRPPSLSALDQGIPRMAWESVFLMPSSDRSRWLRGMGSTRFLIPMPSSQELTRQKMTASTSPGVTARSPLRDCRSPVYLVSSPLASFSTLQMLSTPFAARTMMPRISSRLFFKISIELNSISRCSSEACDVIPAQLLRRAW